MVDGNVVFYGIDIAIMNLDIWKSLTNVQSWLNVGESKCTTGDYVHL